MYYHYFLNTTVCIPCFWPSGMRKCGSGMFGQPQREFSIYDGQCLRWSAEFSIYDGQRNLAFMMVILEMGKR